MKRNERGNSMIVLLIMVALIATVFFSLAHEQTIESAKVQAEIKSMQSKAEFIFVEKDEAGSTYKLTWSQPTTPDIAQEAVKQLFSAKDFSNILPLNTAFEYKEGKVVAVTVKYGTK